MSDIRVRVGQQNSVKVVSSVSGSAGGRATSADNLLGGYALISNLYVTGISTFDSDSYFNNNLYVSGISTFNSDLYFDKNLYVSGISTFDSDSYFNNNLYVDGISFFNSQVSIFDDLYVSGISTFVGIGTFENNLYVGGNFEVKGTSEFIGSVIFRGGIINIGQSDSDDIVVSGEFASSLVPTDDAQYNLGLPVKRWKNLYIAETVNTNQINASGVSTFLSSVGINSFVSALEYYGPLVFGQPEGGFKPGAIEIQEDDYTKNSINDINFILGKLVPKPPNTVLNASFSILNLSSGILCSGFTPTNNTLGVYSVTPGTSYPRNTDNTVTSTWLTEYGPGDQGTVSAMINFTAEGSREMTTNDVINPDNSISNDVNSDDGTYGSLEIANDKDAFFSSRNTGIASDFYEVYDSRMVNANSPNGFNMAYIRHEVGANTFESQKYLYYEDPSTVSAPSLTATTPITPALPVLNYSSGIPHYTQSTSNAFVYDITCLNATGDMYSNYTFLTSSGQTTGFQNGGNKNYGNFGGSNPPVRNFGVDAGVTGSVSQIPRDLHITVTTDTQKFSLYTASTPYGSGTVRATIPQIVNIMGTTARTDVIDEDNILIQTLGSGSGNARRVNAGATGDNPTPVYTSWSASSPVATYEATVIGGDLKHDQTNYSTGYLPVGPDYSSGRSGSQYFQLEMIRSNVSEFFIVINGTYSGCWVCMPDNSAWTTSLSGVNGWANMFQAYKGSGIPTTAQPGCAQAGNMTGGTGTFRCVFGTESSSNDLNNRILVRFKLNSGNQINTLSFRNT
jgi:hypothetical protein